MKRRLDVEFIIVYGIEVFIDLFFFYFSVCFVKSYECQLFSGSKFKINYDCRIQIWNLVYWIGKEFKEFIIVVLFRKGAEFQKERITEGGGEF